MAVPYLGSRNLHSVSVIFRFGRRKMHHLDTSKGRGTIPVHCTDRFTYNQSPLTLIRERGCFVLNHHVYKFAIIVQPNQSTYNLDNCPMRLHRRRPTWHDEGRRFAMTRERSTCYVLVVRSYLSFFRLLSWLPTFRIR